MSGNGDWRPVSEPRSRQCSNTKSWARILLIALTGVASIASDCPVVIVDPCGRPVAVAEASPEVGDAPLHVEFRGDASYCIEGVGCCPDQTYQWDFDNGRTSSQANDTITYTKAGNYRPRLRLKSTTGEDSDSVLVVVFEVRAITGTISFIDLEGGFYAIRGDDGVTYDPLNLPSEFRQHALRLSATLRLRHDLTSVHMVGPLVEVLSIQSLPP
jgi:hypothetical protein